MSDYIDKSDIASRQRMTDADWLKETIDEGHFRDSLDPDEIASEIHDLYKFYRHDAAYLGARVIQYLDSQAKSVAKERKQEFETETGEG